MPALRRVVQHADRDLPIIDIRTQQEQIDATMQMERTFAALTSGFGVLALALACVGIYGIMAYSVAQRTNEIGIRLALGAQPGQVRGMILRESTWLAVAGIVVGVGAALRLTRLVKSMLYGIQPCDPARLLAGVLGFAGCCAGRELDSGAARGGSAADGGACGTSNGPKSGHGHRRREMCMIVVSFTTFGRTHVGLCRRMAPSLLNCSFSRRSARVTAAKKEPAQCPCEVHSNSMI